MKTYFAIFAALVILSLIITLALPVCGGPKKVTAPSVPPADEPAVKPVMTPQLVGMSGMACECKAEMQLWYTGQVCYFQCPACGRQFLFQWMNGDDIYAVEVRIKQ